MIPVRNILFITLSNLGDVILTVPVLSVLRGNFTEAAITVIVGPRAYPVLQGSAIADEIMIYDKKGSLFYKWKLVRDLQNRKFDLVVDLKNSAFPYLLNPRVRTGCFRGGLKKIVSKREQHLACLRHVEKKLPIDYGKSTPFDFFSETDLWTVKNKLKARGLENSRLAVMAAGANTHLKRWTAEGFAAVADRLTREQKMKVVLIGAENDRPVIDEITQYANERLADFCGETTMRQIAALLSLSGLLVANDSSAMQLAYEMKIPVVAVFGPTDDRKFGRENETSVVVRKNLPCAPCGAAQCLIPEIKKCLHEITPGEVYQACAKLLSRRENTRNAVAPV